MADTNYQYSITNDFPNDKVEAAKLKYEIEQSSISSASILYVHSSGDNCNVWFDGVLTSGDETTLDGIVAAHDGDTLTDILEYDGYVSTNEGFSFYTTPEIRDCNVCVYRNTDDMMFKDNNVSPVSLYDVVYGRNILSNIVFRIDPTSNGEESLLGWYDTSDTSKSLSSSTPVTATMKGYHSHYVFDVSNATGLPFTVRLTGTSINESNGNTTASDTEDISVTSNGYYQSEKSWVDDVEFSIVESSKSCTIDIYRTTYWDRGNNDFTVNGCRLEWEPDAGEWYIKVRLIHLDDSGSMSYIDNIEISDTDTIPRAENGVSGKYKRGDYNHIINGAGKEGLIIKVDQKAIKSFLLEVKYSG